MILDNAESFCSAQQISQHVSLLYIRMHFGVYSFLDCASSFGTKDVPYKPSVQQCETELVSASGCGCEKILPLNLSNILALGFF